MPYLGYDDEEFPGGYFPGGYFPGCRTESTKTLGQGVKKFSVMRPSE